MGQAVQSTAVLKLQNHRRSRLGALDGGFLASADDWSVVELPIRQRFRRDR
jgi:hypothetical protein